MHNFEKNRAYLSHDRFQNQFLASIAYDMNNKKSSDRNLKLYQALKGDRERMNQIKKAFSEWPDLHSSIVNFLDNLPQKYGFVLSEEYKKKKLEISNELNKINEFIKLFLSNKVHDSKLEIFWNAIDKVRIFLNSLGYERDRYVLDIDPSLIKENHNG